MADELLTSTADHVLTLTLNRPTKRNALNQKMIAAVRSTIARVGDDPSVRVIVIRGNGPAFCSGMDLREMAAQREQGEADLGGLEKITEDIEACPLPTIAAVHGDAIAGGAELALHCDIIVAADTARFSMPLARIGLAVPVTLTWKLVDTIGAIKTNELLFTGEAISADTALSLGLVNRVVPADELDGALANLTRQITQNAPLSIRAMKAFVQRAVGFRRDTPRDDLEEMHRVVRSSKDLKEGLAAQRERRQPKFIGK